jgi:DNA-binding NarL/FixJ family response regulator
MMTGGSAGPAMQAAGSAQPIRVFLLDDHEIVRRGIAELFDHEPDVVVTGEAGTVAGAMEAIGAARPDVALLDARLPDGTGLELCRDIRSAFPHVRCLILTSYDEPDAVCAAVLAGAHGYLLKQIRGTNLADAVRTVARGDTLLSPDVVDRVLAMLHEAPARVTLTPREADLLEHVTRGQTNSEIAAVTDLPERSVRVYVSGLIAKLIAHF